MIFRDDRQLARVCGELLSTVHLGHLWSADGPSDRACELLDADGGPLSSGERIVLLAAWSLWNGSGGVSFSDVVHRLDADRRNRIASLLLCRDSSAVDSWLACAPELAKEGE